MEKQEIEQLDLSRWVIVHETPLMGWLGRLSEDDWRAQENEIDGPLCFSTCTLHEALVIQTTQVPVPGPGGQMQLGIITNVMAPHQFTTESLVVSVKPRATTLVASLSAFDQRSLLMKVVVARDSMIRQRAAASGIVAAGPRA
jgi:hypothetical protein